MKSRKNYGAGPGRPPTEWTDSRCRQLVRLVLDSDLSLTEIPAALEDGDFHPCKTTCRTQFIKLAGCPPDTWRLHDPAKKAVRRDQTLRAMEAARSREISPDAKSPNEPFPTSLVHPDNYGLHHMDSRNFAGTESDLSSSTRVSSISSFRRVEAGPSDSAIYPSSLADRTNDFGEGVLIAPNNPSMMPNVNFGTTTTFKGQHIRKQSAPADLEGATPKHMRWSSKTAEHQSIEFVKRLSNSRSSIASALSFNGSIASRWSNPRSSRRLSDYQPTWPSIGIDDTFPNSQFDTNITDAFNDFTGDNYDHITALLRTFLDSGAGVNDRNSKGETALHIAAGHGNITACEFLLNNGADVYAVTSTGESISKYTKSKSRETADPGLYAKIKCCRNMIKGHDMGKPLKSKRKRALSSSLTAQEIQHKHSTSWTGFEMVSRQISINTPAVDGSLRGQMGNSREFERLRRAMPLSRDMGFYPDAPFDPNNFPLDVSRPGSLSYPPGTGQYLPSYTVSTRPPSIKVDFHQVWWGSGEAGDILRSEGGQETYLVHHSPYRWPDRETPTQPENVPGANYPVNFEFSGQHPVSETYAGGFPGSTATSNVIPYQTTSDRRFPNLQVLTTDTQGGWHNTELSPRQLMPSSNFNYPPTSAHAIQAPRAYEGVTSTFEDLNISYRNDVAVEHEDTNAKSWGSCVDPESLHR